MKSEHRHELKTNELERLATEWTKTSEHFVHDHPGTLVGIGVAVVVAIVGLIYWNSTAGSGDQKGWQEMANASFANSTAEFANIADKYADKRIGAWARLQEAESELFSGIRLQFTDRTSGVSDLKKAKENFDKLIKEKSTPDEALERAMFGLAQCTEALPTDPNAPPSKIDDPAITAYENLLKRFPDSIFKPIAESRIAALRTARTQDFYAWFDKQNPKPADREVPKDLIPPPPPVPFSSSATPGSETTPSTGATGNTSKSESPSKPAPAANGKSPKTGSNSDAPKTSSPEKTPAPSRTKPSGSGPMIPGP